MTTSTSPRSTGSFASATTESYTQSGETRSGFSLSGTAAQFTVMCRRATPRNASAGRAHVGEHDPIVQRIPPVLFKRRVARRGTRWEDRRGEAMKAMRSGSVFVLAVLSLTAVAVLGLHDAASAHPVQVFRSCGL